MRLKDMVRGNGSRSIPFVNGGDSGSNKKPKMTLEVRDIFQFQIGLGTRSAEGVQDKVLFDGGNGEAFFP